MKPRRWGYVLRMRARSLFRRTTVDRELKKELQFHIEQQMAEHTAHGLAPEEARYAALRRLGGLSTIEEECRDMRGTNFISDIKQDLGYAARMLVKSSGFTLAIVLTLALSIGATSAIVSVIEGVLLRSLPYQNPDRLVRIFYNSSNFPKFPVNPNDFRDFRSRLHSFESMAAYTHSDLQFAGTGEAIRLSGFAVTAGFFHVLGVHPAIGRDFTTADELPGKGRVAIIGDQLWRTRLGGRRDVLGRKIVLNAEPYSVIGVLPPGVQHPGNMYHAVAYGETVDIWTPFTFSDPNDRGAHYMDAIARLRPGVSLGQATGEINAAMQQLGREHPDGDSGWKIALIPLQSEIVGRSRRMLFVLLAASVLVLLLSCVNAANLLLARATVRQREMAVRAAVGAGRRRLVRQVLTESVLLAALGALFGAVLALVGVRTLVHMLPADFPRAGDIHVDLPVFLFTLLLALATGILFGLVPALQASRADLRDALHEGGRAASASRSTLRLRNALVISEITLACILLIGAGLMLRTFVNLLHLDPGFRPEHVITASISLPEATYKNQQAITRFYQSLLATVASKQGVSAVGAGSDLPWTGYDENAGGFQVDGHPAPPHAEFHGRYHMATPGYFRALGIPLLHGRFFDEHDTVTSRKVLLINKAMAERYWGKENAVGGRLTFSDHPKEADWMTVVGIVGDVKDTPKSDGAEPAFWWPLTQEPFPSGNMSVAIRGTAGSEVDGGRVARCRTGSRRQSGRRRRAPNDRNRGSIARYSPVHADLSCSLCRCCSGARGHWHLWCDRVLGRPENTRVWRSNGLGRQALGRDCERTADRHDTCRFRHAARDRARRAAISPARQFALRRKRGGSSRHRHNVRPGFDRRRSRVLCAGRAGDTSRSHVRTAK